MSEPVELTIAAVLASWEDEDRNRYFPLGDGRVAVRDGGSGTWRAVMVSNDTNDPAEECA